MLVMSRVNGGVHERQSVLFTRLIWGSPTASSRPGVKDQVHAWISYT